jgi:hypothetical protein
MMFQLNQFTYGKGISSSIGGQLEPRIFGAMGWDATLLSLYPTIGYQTIG